MKKTKYILLIITLLGLASCVKEVDFNGEQSESLLVINGIQQVGQPTHLNIEKSHFFMDADKDCRVKDLVVDLYVNGAFKETLMVRDSLLITTYIDWNGGNEVEVEQLDYAFNYCEGQYVLCAGDQLRFEVRSSEFDMATVEVAMPDVPNVISFETVSVDTATYTVHFALKLDDPVGADFYNLYPRDGLDGFISSDPVFTDYMDLYTEDLTGESSDYYGRGPYNVFRDFYFDGKTYTVSLSTSIWELDFQEPFTLEVSRVDENLYRYQTTYEAYIESDPESFIGMFTEPVQVYSNVKNGVGVVTAQSQPVVFSIDLTSYFLLLTSKF